MTLTSAHLNDLTDSELRTIALSILRDAVNALDTRWEELDQLYDVGDGDYPGLDIDAAHDAVGWLCALFTTPADYDKASHSDHSDAVYGFHDSAHDVGAVASAEPGEFPLFLNAAALSWLIDSLHTDGGCAHRPDPGCLHDALDWCGGEFLPRRDTAATYVIRILHPSDDPRHAALAESYLTSGLHIGLHDAIDEATKQLALLDDLEDINR